MLRLLKYKPFRGSLCIALAVSLCCIPLFGCGGTSPDDSTGLDYSWVDGI